MEDTALTEEELGFMKKAFQYAHEALAAKEVPVGCLFIYNNKIISVGRNEVNKTRNATRHAEFICIDQVNSFCNTNTLNIDEVFKHTSVYVTVEPCIMCAAALFDLNVKRIVFGCKNDRFGGQTVFDVFEILRPNTVVKGGYSAEEGLHLLKLFYQGTNPSAPIGKIKIKSTKKQEK